MDTRIRVDRRFAIIDEWVLDLDISDRAVRLYALLMRYADKDTHKAFPSRKTLAERLKCSPASVDRASMELIDVGLMSKKQRHNNSLVYTLHTSSPVQTPIITHDDTLSSPVTTAISTGDDLTITTKREPKNENHLTKAKPKDADDYQPSEAILADFEQRYPGIRLDVELEKFRDHHMAAGSNFKDWDRAFRKWLRQASEWSKDARSARAQQQADADWERFKRENGLD
jgi:predicted transcriptional regulator